MAESKCYEETLYRVGAEIERQSHKIKINLCIEESNLTKEHIKELRIDFESAIEELMKTISKRYPLKAE